MSSATQPTKPKPDLGQIIAVAKQLGLLDALANVLKGLFQKTPKPPVVVPPAEVPNTPGVPTPIPAPLPSAPNNQPGRDISQVRLRVQKAERPNDPGNLYDDPMGMVRNGSNFNFGAHLWLDMSAFDQEGEEWQGHSIKAADLEYRTKLNIYKDGHLVAFIHGQGGDEQAPNDWRQMVSHEVTFGQRAWKDSLGMNTRTNFLAEGVYEAEGEFAGMKSNRLTIRVS